MKKIIQIVCLFFMVNSFAQTDVINDLLNIKYNYKAFNLNNDVKELSSKTGYWIGMGYFYSSFSVYEFNKSGNLVKEYSHQKDEKNHNRSNFEEITYSYIKNNQLSEIHVILDDVPKENYIFQYDKKERLVQVTHSDLKLDSKVIYIIKWKNNLPIKYLVKERGEIIYETYSHEFDENKNIIHFGTIESGETSSLDRVYNDNSFLTKEVYKDNSNSEYNYSIDYTSNSYNDILTKTENDIKRTYEYDEGYDKNNNWIERTERTSRTSYNTIREIKYGLFLVDEENVSISSGYVWKTDKKGFSFYANGDNRTEKIVYTYFGNHCVIYDTVNNKSYLLKNIKDKIKSNFNSAIELEGNKFGYRFNQESFLIIINAQLYSNTAGASYAQNGLDMITINKANQKEYVLPNYKNTPLSTLIPAINYSDYTKNPTADNKLNNKVENCNADKKCLTNLYDEMYDEYKKQSTQDQLAQKMAGYIVKVHGVHPHLAFSVLLSNKRDISILTPLMEKLPKNIRTSIRSGSREMLNDYNKYINSKEVRNKVKENGGGYIKSKN